MPMFRMCTDPQGTQPHLLHRVVGAAHEDAVKELGHIAGLQGQGPEVGNRCREVLEGPGVVELEVCLKAERDPVSNEM